MNSTPTGRRKSLLGLLAVASLLTTACSSAPRSSSTPATTIPRPAAIELQLRQAALDWEGTPHRIGGFDRRGIDCSGLVVRIYDDIFGYRLPRTTGALARAGRPANRQALVAGDLVLFRIAARKQHVGIYLGQEEFVHASATRGVMISRLNENYWRRTFWTARRILD